MTVPSVEDTFFYYIYCCYLNNYAVCVQLADVMDYGLIRHARYLL
jgi:hypothetical protein